MKMSNMVEGNHCGNRSTTTPSLAEVRVSLLNIAERLAAEVPPTSSAGLDIICLCKVY